MFQQGQIDGAWVPEPWATRLVIDGHGVVFLDERSLWPNGEFVTTNVVVRAAFLQEHPDLVKKFLQAHVDTVQYIRKNPERAKELVNSEIQRITGKALTKQVLDQAYTDLNITYDPLASTLLQSASRAYALGFLGQSKPDLNGMYHLSELNAVLVSRGLASVTGP